MTTKLELPPNYIPYEELIICSNVMINGTLPFRIEGYSPFLAGKGEIPRIWLSAFINPSERRWLNLIVDNQIVGNPTFEKHPLKLNISKEEKWISVTVGEYTILHVQKRSETQAIITRLDLRPLGFNITGNEEGLSIGNSNFRGNRFENVHTMIAIGPEQPPEQK